MNNPINHIDLILFNLKLNCYYKKYLRVKPLCQYIHLIEVTACLIQMKHLPQKIEN